MLTESFVAAVLYAEKPASTSSALKDASIHLHDYRPLPSLKSSFKKSSTKPNCLAVGASHIFAAQSDKAAIQVYSRERGNQEVFVPLQEKVASLALIGELRDAGILAMGTEGGRLLLWELCTGRLVSTPASHLQEITCLAVDPTCNFLLSGSADSNIHVWSIPQLLSFSTSSCSPKSSYAPTGTLSTHRGAITALGFGHSHTSANFAISGARDELCIIWDCHTGTALHTFLLPSTPLCLVLDPADRAFYAGYEDASVQQVDLYDKANLVQASRDPDLQNTPTQPPPTSRWPGPPSPSASPTLCLTLSYDSTVLLSGHQNGKVQTWNVAKGTFDATLTDFSSPVTNLQMLPPTGFPHPKKPSLKLQSVVKPRFGVSSSGNSTSIVPESHTVTAQLLTPPPTPSPDPSFSSLLAHPTFPGPLLSTSLASLLATTTPSSTSTNPATSTSETESLRAELSVLRASQAGHADKAITLNAELRRLKAVLNQKRRLKDARRKKREDAEFRWREASMRGEAPGVREGMDFEEMVAATTLAVEGMEEAGRQAEREWEVDRKKGEGMEEGDEVLEELSSSTEGLGSD